MLLQKASGELNYQRATAAGVSSGACASTDKPSLPEQGIALVVLHLLRVPGLELAPTRLVPLLVKANFSARRYVYWRACLQAAQHPSTYTSSMSVSVFHFRSAPSVSDTR